ncbi:MAG: hypothetical protein ACTFAK_13425 [Candidatus Electronema sp. VV]
MNPFKILNIGPEAEAQEVMRAAALALREKRHSAREIAEARQLLMDPALRPVLAFLHCNDLGPLLRPPERPVSPLNADTLQRLEIFD